MTTEIKILGIKVDATLEELKESLEKERSFTLWIIGEENWVSIFLEDSLNEECIISLGDFSRKEALSISSALKTASKTASTKVL